MPHTAHHPVNAPLDRQGSAPRHLPGVLEVLHVRRIKMEANGIALDGIPGSRSSKVRHARITFVANGEHVPKPVLDETAGRMDLFYAQAEKDDVLIQLRSGRERLCYFWKDGQSDRVRAWLMVTD
jgi:hypothetical protein